jgi:hypothetical protein
MDIPPPLVDREDAVYLCVNICPNLLCAIARELRHYSWREHWGSIKYALRLNVFNSRLVNPVLFILQFNLVPAVDLYKRRGSFRDLFVVCCLLGHVFNDTTLWRWCWRRHNYRRTA